MKQSLNREKISKIINSIAVRDCHRYYKLDNDLDFSSATISKYLREMQDLGILKKELTDTDEPGYFLTELGKDLSDLSAKGLFPSQTIEQSKNSIVKRKKELQYLEENGIFEEGINSEDALKFVQKFGRDTKFKKYSKTDTLDLITFRMFIGKIIGLLGSRDGDSDTVDLELKIDSDKNKFSIEEEEFDKITKKFQES
jgi:DNA-binding HxlR family transcriptional regulator